MIDTSIAEFRVRLTLIIADGVVTLTLLAVGAGLHVYIRCALSTV